MTLAKGRILDPPTPCMAKDTNMKCMCKDASVI